MEVAKEVGGEIISADAFAVYRGLDIGTDKPTPDDRAEIRHHLLDVADPIERFSAGAFADAAKTAIDEIRTRARIPLIVGGTHFYIRALLLGLFPSPPHDPVLSAALADQWSRDPAAVFQALGQVDPEAAHRIGPNDRQRLLRALEVFELTGEPLSAHWDRQNPTLKFNPLMVAPKRSRAELYARIDARVDSIFSTGLVEEIERILASGVPTDAHALKAIGYREVVDLLKGKCDLRTAIDLTKRSSRKLAKRQLTWLRTLREGTLHWVPTAEEGGASAIIDLWGRHTEGGRGI
jgi:tRNA dimethylallyltransferase